MTLIWQQPVSEVQFLVGAAPLPQTKFRSSNAGFWIWVQIYLISPSGLAQKLWRFTFNNANIVCTLLIWAVGLSSSLWAKFHWELGWERGEAHLSTNGWEGHQGKARGCKGKSCLGSRLRNLSRVFLALVGFFWEKNLGSGKPPIIPSWEIFQEGIIAGLKSGI